MTEEEGELQKGIKNEAIRNLTLRQIVKPSIAERKDYVHVETVLKIIEEAKKEFPKKDLAITLEKGTFNVGYSTFAKNVEKWFVRWFGGESSEG